MCKRSNGRCCLYNATTVGTIYIVLLTKKTRATTSSQMSFLLPHEKKVSGQNVVRRLHGKGIYARRHDLCAPLVSILCTACFQYCHPLCKFPHGATFNFVAFIVDNITRPYQSSDIRAFSYDFVSMSFTSFPLETFSLDFQITS